MALAQFGDLFVVKCESINDKEFLLTFKYRDTMMRALKQVKGCEMRLPSQLTNLEKDDPIMKVKKELGL